MPFVEVGPQAADRCNSEALMLAAHAKHVIQLRTALVEIATLDCGLIFGLQAQILRLGLDILRLGRVLLYCTSASSSGQTPLEVAYPA